MHTIEAIIFDMDGVLSDTIELHYRVWQQIADEIGIPFSHDRMDNLRGKQRRECLIEILDGYPLPDERINHYLKLKDIYYLSLLEGISPDALLMPGVHAFIDQVEQAGLPMGVASASANAVPTLKKLGLYNRMQVVADGVTVANSKPAPDIFIWTAGAMRIRPARVLVFEDAAAGVQAAQSAGMRVIGLGASEIVGRADVVLPGLQGARLDDILNRGNLTIQRIDPQTNADHAR